MCILLSSNAHKTAYIINLDRSIQEKWHDIFLKDKSILQKMYKVCLPNIISYVTNNNGDRTEAEDLYHEAFLAVWRNIQLGRFSPDSEEVFKAYLSRVARNKWIDQLRKNKCGITKEWTDRHDVSDEPLSSDRNETDEFLDKVVISFSRLGEQCRKLLKMFYYKNETMKTIAETFGWTAATAKNNKYRCMQKLRKIINGPESE